MASTSISAIKALLYTCAIASLAACASTNQPYKLDSISNFKRIDSEKHQIMAFVELNSTKPNRISVFNWDTYKTFNVYKKTGSSQKFSMYATLTAGDPPDISSTLVMFEDTKSSTLEDRYELKPTKDGIELEALPIEYVTNDSSYYSKLERNKPLP